ncbi:hypothetical protein AJ88_09535 [Mesorhizobium amorphae CCBAU 01583]|nr:hypothetical protein AJ88_09535 [Mesorhizobium amorphae CCBAU 01583]
MESPNFPALGRCIFCLKPFGPDRAPTDEHIIGQFAGGTVYIKDGACEPCARLTNRLYESAASATTFFAFRLWMGLLGNKARGLPNMAAGNKMRAAEADFDIAVTRYTRPPVFTLPVFPPPLFWQGKTGYRHDQLRLSFANFIGEDCQIQAGFFFRMDRRKRPQMEVRTYLATLDVTLLERHDMRGLMLMLAKIAYCFVSPYLGLRLLMASLCVIFWLSGASIWLRS